MFTPELQTLGWYQVTLWWGIKVVKGIKVLNHLTKNVEIIPHYPGGSM